LPRIFCFVMRRPRGPTLDTIENRYRAVVGSQSIVRRMRGIWRTDHLLDRIVVYCVACFRDGTGRRSKRRADRRAPGQDGPQHMNQAIAFFRVLGSLWVAAVLLVLLLLAMACATVFESVHGSEQALIVFYDAWWFECLLGLLAANVLVALIVRSPFSRRQAGFALTHLSILAVLGGALVTQKVGIDGHVGVVEGQTVSELTLNDRLVVSVVNRSEGATKLLDLDDRVFHGFEEVSFDHDCPSLDAGSLHVEVARYLPDSELGERVVDDHPHSRPAVEVLLSSTGRDDPVWVFSGQSAKIGPLEVAYSAEATAEAVKRHLQSPATEASSSKGDVKVEYQGKTALVPLERCMDQPAAAGDTGCAVRVLRYLPHAKVGPDHQIVNASQQPINPYIEVELTRPDGQRESRRAFARFPDLSSMHGTSRPADEIRVTFVAGVEAPAPASAPVEIVSGPDGRLSARFVGMDKTTTTTELSLGEAVETPWPGWKLTVSRRFAHARWDRAVLPVVPVRQARIPAVLLRLRMGGQTSEMWAQQYSTYPISVGGAAHEIAFTSKTMPLGFDLTLDRFRIGTYPGTNQPRSYESHVTIQSPATGEQVSRVISMNAPASYGGFAFYQSSYAQERGRSVSYLSVSRDPGRPIVFAGYFGMMAGMVWVLAQRMKERRRQAVRPG